ncbi:MAG: hypothetical protein LKJ69_08410 [Lactobacillus sp.]|jgi:hypothetical protein|nr:hypothetical protein [Lactobacillus sp.]MCI2033413.1 hypothetical protein [Lactobacillus sp.]
MVNAQFIDFPKSATELFRELSADPQASRFFDFNQLKAPSGNIESNWSQWQQQRQSSSQKAQAESKRLSKQLLDDINEALPQKKPRTNNQSSSQRVFSSEEEQVKARYADLSQTYRSINNKLLRKRIESYNFPDKQRGINEIFLSYAVKDLAVATALFFWFRRYDCFLYVDYLFNSKTPSDQLKSVLRQELARSNQFLFADSIESQLKIDSNYYIRPWCAWENGAYLGKQGNNNNPCFRIQWYSAEVHGKSAKAKMTEDMLVLRRFDKQNKRMKD